MGKKRLKKLTEEYREAVLSGRTDLANLEAELKIEAGNGFADIVAQVAREKAEQGAGSEIVQEAAASSEQTADGEPSVPVTENLPAFSADGDSRSVEDVFPAVPESMCRTHPNDVSALPPSPVWEVCIDESYLGKDHSEVREGDFFGKDGDGLIAGVVFSPSNPLPPVAQLHCKKDEKKEGPKTPEELQQEEEALETILRHPACGVLALPTRAQEMTLGYTDLLISWTCVMIMLLPLPEGEDVVVVRCHVEPRPELQSASDFAAYQMSCERQLRESFPALARRVRLDCVPMPKVEKGSNKKTLNSYADVVAHTCQAFGQVARKRFARTNWSGVCYLDADPKAMEQLLRVVFRQGSIEGGAWTALLKCEKAGFARKLIEHVGDRVRHDSIEWQKCLDRVAEHLRSGAIDMRLLRKQVDWLETYLPVEPLPMQTELIWLTAKLALANHEGHRAPGMAEAARVHFDKICAALYEQNVQLVCRAVLNLAVAYTNAYEFEMALGVLQSLLDKEPAFVGLENYGQLLSSAGQHFAFMGDTENAIANFKAAIDCFDRLQDSAVREKNIMITSAYLATATMDGKPDEAISALTYYLLEKAQAPVEELVKEVERLAQVPAESFLDKFKHHIVLRYAVTAEREDPIRQTYRACWRDRKWSTPGEGHPWELIELYRALLLPPDVPERQERFERAYKIAVGEGGDTVMVIAAVIAGAALKEGKNLDRWSERLAEACQQVAHIRALWDNGRFQTLVDQTPEGGLNALALARKVLPFNFR